jgi:MotA/TolQ/ExbB proton channel family
VSWFPAAVAAALQNRRPRLARGVRRPKIAVGKLDTGRATGTIVCRPREKMSPMAVTAAPADFRVETRLPSDYLPLLRWMIFTGVCLFGFVLAWHFGLIRMMLSSDKTYISVIILILYAAASVHCLVRTVTISRELSKAMRILALVRGGTHEYKVVGEDVVNGEGAMLPRGEVTTHIRNLIMKDKLQGDTHRLDQTLLLRGLADALRGPNQLGGYASDSLMKLGLLGTIIGFIMMLGPIAGLDAADHASVKSSMGLMSDGMAVAMYTTLTGLIGSILVQTQYYMLDKATAQLFGLATNLTEVFVVSVLDRGPNGNVR